MATQTAIIFDQDGSVREVTYDDKNQSQVLHDAVGGWIESVSYWTKNIDAYVNEEGLYTPGLYPNPHARRAFGQTWMGNLVIPKVTPTKRKRLAAMGLPVPE